MTYQQAKCVGIFKRILGCFVFVVALISTSISVINYIYAYNRDSHELTMVIKDFIRITVDMLRTYTGFLDYFWLNSPVPTIGTGFSQNNVMFLLIYFLIFVGLALNASGARMGRQVKNVRENVQDLAVVEQLKGDDALSYHEMIGKLRFPHHTILLQFFRLYFLPIAIAAVVYFAMTEFSRLGF